MSGLADLMFYLEQTINQGQSHQDSLLSNQPEDVKDEWEGDADAVERFLKKTR